MPIPDIEWNLEDYLRTFRSHRWSVVLTTVLFGGFTAIHMSQMPNIYQATARILIEAQPAQIVQFKEVAPYTAGGWIQGFLQTEYRIITSPEVMEKVVEELSLAAFPPFSKSDDPVGLLQGMVQVDLVRGTKLVDISASSTKAELAAKISNTIADTYARINLERRQEMTTGGAQWLKDEVVKAEEKMKTAQLALQQFKEHYRALPVGKEEQNMVLQRLDQLNTVVTEAKEQRIEAETKYRAKHPTLLEFQAKERELGLALKEQEQIVLDMNRLAIEYNNLQREAQTNESIYNSLLTRLKEITVQEGTQSNNVQVVSYAKVRKVPVSPKRGRSTLLAAFLGFFVGCVLALLRESLGKTLRTRREFEQILKIPFLGNVPAIRLSKEHRGNESLLLLTEPQSTAAEAIRAIRTTLEFLLPTGSPHTLLITSAIPEEGKSLISLNLSIALLELGRKVVLIDADMRRPSLHRLFNLPLEPGLSGYLQGQSEIGDLVQMTAIGTPLAMIPAGMTPDQPADLLNTPKMKELIEALKRDYQYVLIDTPPVLAVADTTAMANLAEGVIYVVRGGRTHREVALAGKDRLLDVGARIIGGGLNGIRIETSLDYRYYYYYKGSRHVKRAQKGSPPSPKSPGASEESHSSESV